MNEASEPNPAEIKQSDPDIKRWVKMKRRLRSIFDPGKSFIGNSNAAHRQFTRREFLRGSGIVIGSLIADRLVGSDRAYAAAGSEESGSYKPEIIVANTLHETEFTTQDEGMIELLVVAAGGREALQNIIQQQSLEYDNPYGEAPQPIIENSIKNYLASGNEKMRILAQDFPKEDFITNSFENRSVENYVQVLQQFGIELPDSIFCPDQYTYCNLWVKQAFRMLGWDFNWYGQDENGKLQRPYGTLANDIYDQLNSRVGVGKGMVKIPGQLAVKLANQGIPVAGSVKNYQGHPGHIWMVLPTPEGEVFRAANVGRENYFDEPFRYKDYTSDDGYEDIIYVCTEKDFAHFVLNQYDVNHEDDSDRQRTGLKTKFQSPH